MSLVFKNFKLIGLLLFAFSANAEKQEQINPQNNLDSRFNVTLEIVDNRLVEVVSKPVTKITSHEEANDFIDGLSIYKSPFNKETLTKFLERLYKLGAKYEYNLRFMSPRTKLPEHKQLFLSVKVSEYVFSAQNLFSRRTLSNDQLSEIIADVYADKADNIIHIKKEKEENE